MVKKLYTVELFSGTESFSNIAKERNHFTFTCDIDKSFTPDLVGDILNHKIQMILKPKILSADVVWMSPLCDCWSMASGNNYFTEFRQPRNEKALDSIKMMLYCRWVADQMIKRKKIFFIENPMGKAIWILDNKYLKRVWYCQYGEKYAKPTNIWTNLDIEFKTCSNSNLDCDHELASRGSKKGLQGIIDKKNRGKVPMDLINYIFDKLEGII